jgi:DNA-binding MarR family transcriptional regulator
MRQIIAEHSARYDAIVYFCSPQALTLMKRVKKELDNPKLFVQALPGWSSSPPKPRRPKSTEVIRPRRGEAKPEEVPILDLISEQGAIPVDQLARFLDYTPHKAKQIAKHLHEEGLIRREKLLAQEPEWLWLTKRGARFSNRDLSAPRIRIGSLALIRATNDVRIAIAKSGTNVRWISRRLLLHEWGRNAAAPRAVIQIGDEHHAIEVRLAPSLESRIEELIWRRLSDYDAMVCFCAPSAKRQLERLEKAHHWPTLLVRGLPYSD